METSVEEMGYSWEQIRSSSRKRELVYMRMIIAKVADEYDLRDFVTSELLNRNRSACTYYRKELPNVQNISAMANVVLDELRGKMLKNVKRH